MGVLSRWLSTGGLLALAGCAGIAPQQEVITLRSTFDASKARALTSAGTNVIRGNALMRQRGGGVVTCAGSPVTLIPATDYAKERISYLYRMDGDSGFNQRRGDPRFVPDSGEYRQLVLTTKCDAQGNFAFERVADGDFFVHVQISWMAGQAPQGGNLVERVTTLGKPAQSIVMSR